ncbi:unnamed protein product [Notodromas monacha]|uniref:Uncharacterized protein n=1 Tax=Notodromas monacha TaxID=399045 RepID=A0A7R9BYR3_9CRUS|nr:unnamed protein product [Notodromas monacha]CAG0923291.1 unnamed protein product [Notodromas monacha]
MGLCFDILDGLSSLQQFCFEALWKGLFRTAAVGLASFISAAVGTGVVAVVGLPVVLSALGFKGAGVAAGSVAAATQSGIGNVVAGSWFAACQSVGAAGLGAAAMAKIGVAAGAVGGAVTGMTGAVYKRIVK